MNENKKNFQYLEHLQIEFMDPNVKLNKAALNVEKIMHKNLTVIKKKVLKKTQIQKD